MKKTRIVGDRLGSLPDAILTDILNRLPVQTAVSTCVLSREWKDLWTRVLTSLELNENYDKDFFAVVNSVFLKLTSPELNRVNIVIPLEHEFTNEEFPKRCFYYLGAWIPLIYTRSIKRFSLCVGNSKPRPMPLDLVQLPPCLLACRSLVMLKIGGGFQYRLPDDDKSICLPNLKMLHINISLQINQQHEILVKVLKACPFLEDLLLDEDVVDSGNNRPKNDNQRCLFISAHKLRKLTVMFRTQQLYDSVEIDAPELEILNIGDTSLARYTFVEVPRGLDTAQLRLIWSSNLGYESRINALNILKSVSSVRWLGLTSHLLDIFASLMDSAPLPKLNNLEKVNVLYLSWICCRNLMRFLVCCPNLKMINLDLNLSKAGNFNVLNLQPAACLVTMVKVIKIETVGLSKDELELVKYMLSNARVLKSLQVNFSRANYGKVTKAEQLVKEVAFCEELKCLDKYVDCNIVFTGQYLKILSRAGEIRTLGIGKLHCSSMSEASYSTLNSCITPSSCKTN